MANPLIQRPAPPHPAMAHARVWQHVQSMAPDDIASKATQMDALLPVIGGLASNPKVTTKDVIRAAADAVANGAAKPDEAVRFISAMPSESDKVRPWLRGLYSANLAAQVHMKAAMMKGAQGAPQAAPAQPAMPQQPQGGMP